ncbi:MAG TPA: hypothetical protein DGH68_12990 [Bacteroidetes bacterium]|nr:hypothetical protein [Bacteroidota bacterium]
MLPTRFEHFTIISYIIWGYTMKTTLRFLAGLVCTFMLLGGCGGQKKIEPVAVGEMEMYKDPAVGFQIQHPKGWVVNAQVGRAAFYNAAEVDKKFLDPTGAGTIGVEIAVTVTKSPNPVDAIKKWREERTAEFYQLQADQVVTVAGKEATKTAFSANYGNKNVINGHHIFIPVDSTLYDLSFAGFGDHYNAYAAVFDATLKSFQLPKAPEKGRDETLPSETFAEYDAKMFTFQYPDNFNFTNPPKGKNEIVAGFRSDKRQDCNILFDVFGAQGLSLEKVFDQNRGRYKGATAGKATVGGQPAMTVTLSATKDVERRVYFTVKNDKVVRITMDWFKPQRTEYLAAYEKVISSIKFK